MYVKEDAEKEKKSRSLAIIFRKGEDGGWLERSLGREDIRKRPFKICFMEGLAIKLGLLASGKMRMVSRRRWCILCSLRRHQFIPKKSMLDRRSVLNTVCMPILGLSAPLFADRRRAQVFQIKFPSHFPIGIKKMGFFSLSPRGSSVFHYTFLRSATRQKIVSAL